MEIIESISAIAGLISSIIAIVQAIKHWEKKPKTDHTGRITIEVVTPIDKIVDRFIKTFIFAVLCFVAFFLTSITEDTPFFFLFALIFFTLFMIAICQFMAFGLYLILFIGKNN